MTQHMQEDVGGGNFMIKEADSHNLLRPETVESLFILSRVTGNTTYMEWGWQIFRAFEMYTKYEDGGYTNLRSVLHKPPKRSDKMESFFIAETLKYLLLLFSSTDVRTVLLQKLFSCGMLRSSVPSETCSSPSPALAVYALEVLWKTCKQL